MGQSTSTYPKDSLRYLVGLQIGAAKRICHTSTRHHRIRLAQCFYPYIYLLKPASFSTRDQLAAGQRTNPADF